MKQKKIPSLTESIDTHDERGNFRKVFSPDLGFHSEKIVEIFWSQSGLGVVRGLHFQKWPYEEMKLVFVIKGAIADYCVSANPEHPKYGQVFYNEMRQGGPSLIVPGGFAHGFQSLEEDTIVGYATDQPYRPEHESGFNPLSHSDVVWPLPVSQISDRDLMLPAFEEV